MTTGQPPDDISAEVERFCRHINNVCREQRDATQLKKELQATATAFETLADCIRRQSVDIEVLQRENEFLKEGLRFFAPIVDLLPDDSRANLAQYIKAAGVAQTTAVLRDRMNTLNASRGLPQETRTKVVLLDGRLKAEFPIKTKRWQEIARRESLKFGQVRYCLEPQPRGAKKKSSSAKASLRKK